MGSRKELNPYQAMTERWLCCFISVMLFTLIWHGKGQDQQPLAERVIGKQIPSRETTHSQALALGSA
jgi:hypothetical protein